MDDLHKDTALMTEDDTPSTIWLPPLYVRRADAIARAITPANGIQPRRSAVVQKAIDDLFVALGLTDGATDIPESQVAV